MTDNVASFQRHKAESRKDVEDAVVPFASRAHLGEQRSVVAIGIRDDGTTDITLVVDEADVDRIIALLERAKTALILGD